MKTFLLALVFITALTVVAGCNGPRRLRVLAVKHPAVTAELCAKMYPVRERTEVVTRTERDTAFLPGTIIRVNCDSLKTAKQVTGDTTPVIVQVDCPPAQVVREYQRRDSIVWLESTASLAACDAERVKQRDDALRYKRGRNAWRGGAIAGWCIILLTVVIRFGFGRWLR